MGYFKKIVIGALLLSTSRVLPTPIHNLNVDEQKSVMDTTLTESTHECYLHIIHAALLAKVIDCKNTLIDAAIIGHQKCTINPLPAVQLSNPDLKITTTCITCIDTASAESLHERTLRVNFTLPLGTCEGFKINASNITTVLVLPSCIFNASIVDPLQDFTLHVLLTASKVVVNISTTERLQERTLRVNFTLPLGTCEGFKINASNTTTVLVLPSCIFDASIIDSLQGCTVHVLRTASKAVVNISATESLQEHTLCLNLTLSLADYGGFNSTVPRTIVLMLSESIFNASNVDSLQDCTVHVLRPASKAAVKISTTERLQEHTLRLNFTLPLADYEGFNSTVPSTIILALPKSIMKAAIIVSPQDCTLNLLSTASKAAVKISITERLQERTLRLTSTLSLADYEGFNSTVPRTIILALPESIVKAAIIVSPQDCTINLLSTASKAAVKISTTERLQERTLRLTFTLPLADYEGFNSTVPSTIILALSESIVNAAITESLQECTLQKALTLPLADFDNTKTNAPYTAILMVPEAIVNTDNTESLKERTLDAIPTGLLIIFNATNTKKLKERVFTLTLTVSLANQDLETSSRETSGNALMAENSLPEKLSLSKSGSLSGVCSASGKRSLSDNRSPSESAHPSASDHRSPVYGRMIYFIVGAIATCTIAGMMATRLSTLRMRDWRTMSLINILTMAIYIVGILFVVSAGLLLDGMDLTSEGLCRGAIYLCLIFYLGCKVIMYVFLVERAHLLRSVGRTKDTVFLAGIAILILGFGPIVVFSFKESVTDLSDVDGKCRIGLPSAVTIPLLIYDICINILMVGMYGYLAWPYLRGRGSPGIWRRALGRRENRRGLTQGDILELLIWRGYVGACLVVLPTVANMAILFKIHGHEQGWLCFSICTIDVSWSVTIVHWLTGKPEELEESPPPPAGTWVAME